MSEKDGGPAFPAAVEHEEMCDDRDGYRTVREHEGGMSLRDYFAGQAIAPLTERHINLFRVNTLASVAYQIADAMLKERAK